MQFVSISRISLVILDVNIYLRPDRDSKPCLR